jgi:hypothetical protein
MLGLKELLLNIRNCQEQLALGLWVYRRAFVWCVPGRCPPVRRTSRSFLQRCEAKGELAPLLPAVALAAPAYAGQSISQRVVGITFGLDGLSGPIAGFGLLGMLAIWLLVSLLRSVSEYDPDQSRN